MPSRRRTSYTEIYTGGRDVRVPLPLISLVPYWLVEKRAPKDMARWGVILKEPRKKEVFGYYSSLSEAVADVENTTKKMVKKYGVVTRWKIVGKKETITVAATEEWYRTASSSR